jgi:glyoxylase-like metal-dependent hydrolase (beta-lactamase superfamily II)
MADSTLTRRRLMGDAARAGAALATLGVLPAATARPARAAAAVPAQAPAFYRFKVGAFTVTTFSDGNLVLPSPTIFATNAPEAEVKALLEANLLPTDRALAQANVTLVDTGDRRILFDVGSGAGFQPTAGRLAANLAAAGVDPASIGTVVITHAHPDHCWGILDEQGAVRFPKAEFVISEPDWAFWMKQGRADEVPEPMRPFVLGAQRNLGAVAEKTRRTASTTRWCRSPTRPGSSPSTWTRVPPWRRANGSSTWRWPTGCGWSATTCPGPAWARSPAPAVAIAGCRRRSPGSSERQGRRGCQTFRASSSMLPPSMPRIAGSP